jgi:type IV pilus assembly protein PilC
MDKLDFYLPMLFAAVIIMTVSVTAWRCAVRLQHLSETTAARGGVAWFRLLGWLLVWGGALGLFATAVVIGTMAATQPQLVTIIPAAVFAAVAAFLVLFAAVRATMGLRACVVRSESESSPDSPSALPPFLKNIGTPLGLATTVAVVTAVMAVMFELGVLTLGVASVDEQASVVFLLVALFAEIAVLTGIVLVMAAEQMTVPWEQIDHRLRVLLSRVLWTFGMFAGLLAVGPLVAMGAVAAAILVVAAGVFPILAVSTVGGQRRASELTAFWTLLNAVKSRQPLGRELAAQAESMSGRARKLLLLASQDELAGTPIDDYAFHRQLVPRSAWLEVRAGMASGRLVEALQAGAARETQRFSNMSAPGMPRLSAAYFGMLLAVAANVVGFVMYFIVPKFKKIFEDFDTELPRSLISLIAFSDFMVNSALWLLTFCLVIAAFVIEILVNFYGWDGMIERFGSRFWLRLATPDLLRGLKWAVEANQPFDIILRDMAGTPVTFRVKHGLHRAAEAIRHGEDSWVALQRVGWIRPEEAELLRCAEAAGNLPWALETLSQSIGLRRGFRLEWWLQMLHPVLVLTAALFVGWFAIAMFGPLVKLLNDLS